MLLQIHHENILVHQKGNVEAMKIETPNTNSLMMFEKENIMGKDIKLSKDKCIRNCQHSDDQFTKKPLQLNQGYEVIHKRRIIFPCLHDQMNIRKRNDLAISLTITRHSPLKLNEYDASSGRITFNPIVQIHEYEGSNIENWYTPSELKKFRRETTNKRFSNIRNKGTTQACDNDNDISSPIKRILLMDSHDMFLLRLAKSIKKIMPNVTIGTAHSSEEALYVIEKEKAKFLVDEEIPFHGFDVIIAHERLQRPPTTGKNSVPVNGLDLLKQMGSEQSGLSRNTPGHRHSLLIGMTSKARNTKELSSKRIDLLLNKQNLPSIDDEFRNMLIDAVNKKR